jgi:uncharacterized membrane protein
MRAEVLAINGVVNIRTIVDKVVISLGLFCARPELGILAALVLFKIKRPHLFFTVHLLVEIELLMLAVFCR